MANYLNHSGNVAVLFYCMIFGFSFFVTSTLYMVTLHRIESTTVQPHCGHDYDGHQEQPVAMATANNFSKQNKNSTNSANAPQPPQAAPDPPRPPSMTPSNLCEDLRDWKLFANTGLVYGVACIFLGIFQLWPICWGLCLAGGSKTQTISTPKPRGKILKTVASNIVTTHQRLVQEGKRRHQKGSGFWTDCGKFVYITVTYLLLLAFWLTSLIVPIYVATGLATTNAFQGNDGELYPAALALFATCLLSLSFVILSACALICVQSDFWNSIEISSTSSEDLSDNDDSNIVKGGLGAADLEEADGEIDDGMKEPSKSPTSISSYV